MLTAFILIALLSAGLLFRVLELGYANQVALKKADDALRAADAWQEKWMQSQSYTHSVNTMGCPPKFDYLHWIKEDENGRTEETIAFPKGKIDDYLDRLDRLRKFEVMQICRWTDKDNRAWSSPSEAAKRLREVIK